MLLGEKYEPVLQPARPWLTSFFGQVSIPTGKSDLMKRLESNAMYYHSNYLIISMIVSFLLLITRPIALLIAPCIALMFYVSFYKKSGDIMIAKVRLSKNIIIISMSIVTLSIILLSGAYFNLFISYIISAIFILIHLSLRDRNPRSKLDMSKSNVSKIFDPDEMLRRDSEKRSASYPQRVATVTGSSYVPTASYMPTQTAPTVQSNASTNWSGIASDNVPQPVSEDVSKAARRDKQKIMRQRIREQYGLNTAEPPAADTKQQ